MSQHHSTTNEGRALLYGLDKPTGGYFFTEFWKDEEIVDNEEVKNSKDALTLTELVTIFIVEYKYELSNLEVSKLSVEWDKKQDPAPLQYQINKMFGKDLMVMLQRVDFDITTNYS